MMERARRWRNRGLSTGKDVSETDDEARGPGNQKGGKLGHNKRRYFTWSLSANNEASLFIHSYHIPTPNREKQQVE